MREPTIYRVNGRTYMIGDWSVDKALETMVWITKTFGEGILALFMSGEGLDSFDRVMETPADGEEKKVLTEEDKKKLEEAKESEKKLMSNFSDAISKNLDALEYVKYSKKIIEGVKCDGKDVNFSTHFIGKMGELHKVLIQCLRHQYSDFLGGNAEGEQ